jgi:hypothetical protein
MARTRDGAAHIVGTVQNKQYDGNLPEITPDDMIGEAKLDRRVKSFIQGIASFTKEKQYRKG